MFTQLKIRDATQRRLLVKGFHGNDIEENMELIRQVEAELIPGIDLELFRRVRRCKKKTCEILIVQSIDSGQYLAIALAIKGRVIHHYCRRKESFIEAQLRNLERRFNPAHNLGPRSRL